MAHVSAFDRLRAKLVDGWRNRALSLKALTFAVIGVVNTVVDYTVFLLARAAMERSPAVLSSFDALGEWCRCGSGGTLSLIAANVISWVVAVTGSYVMNSSITFAAESGRKLSWRAYLTFVASGVVGWLANTATLVAAAEVLLLPVWAAKALAVLASFAVNFSLSHFIVFRTAQLPAGKAPKR
jgi:putative flippase GtrA